MKKFFKRSVLLLFLITLVNTNSFAKDKKVCSKASPKNKNIVIEFICSYGEEDGDGDCYINKTMNSKKEGIYIIHPYTSYEILPGNFSCNNHTLWSPDGNQFAFFTYHIDLSNNNTKHPHIIVYDLRDDETRTFENGNSAILKPLSFFDPKCGKKVCTGESNYFRFNEDGSLEFNILYLNSASEKKGKGKSCTVKRKLSWIMMNFPLNNIAGSSEMQILTSCK
uniref:Dipeptidylpeptidase IV N-terminal domain-containing protein n=1 Tax=candidate division CPR3 bacterium TaxID=2268181 RepID=A0A7C4R695_UNCC3